MALERSRDSVIASRAFGLRKIKIKVGEGLRKGGKLRRSPKLCHGPQESADHTLGISSLDQCYAKETLLLLDGTGTI